MDKKTKRVSDKLSSRLLAVCRMAEYRRNAADIGCDHGYVSIYLAENNLADRVFAMDVNNGPLLRAKENIEAYGYGERIETRLSDGLSGLSLYEADYAVIAGMGGKLIESIIRNSHAIAEKMDYLIISPHSDLPHVRTFLAENGYEIIDEDIVLEDDKFYQIMKISFRGVKIALTKAEIIYGPVLLKKKSDILGKRIEKDRVSYEKVLSDLRGMGNGNLFAERQEEILDFLNTNKEAWRLLYGENRD